MRRLVVVPCVFSIIACGSHDDGIPLSQLRAAVAAADCERSVRCGYYPDATTCKAAFTWAHDLVAAANTGAIRYDGKAEAACLDFLRKTGCNRTDEYIVAPASCNSAFQGTRKTGETCAFDQECESAKCDTSSCTDLCCTGTCRAPQVTVAVGGDCSGGNARCADGSLCQYSSSTTAICVAAIPLGGSCDPAGDSGKRCPTLAICQADGQGGGTCTPPPAEGQPCDDAYAVPCNSELDYCDSKGNCSRRAGVGQTCADDGACVMYAHCSSGVCEPLKKVGEVCDNSHSWQGDCMMRLGCPDGVCTTGTSQCP